MSDYILRMVVNDQLSSYRYGQYLVANVFWNVTPKHAGRTDYSVAGVQISVIQLHHANRN